MKKPRTPAMRSTFRKPDATTAVPGDTAFLPGQAPPPYLVKYATLILVPDVEKYDDAILLDQAFKLQAARACPFLKMPPTIWHHGKKSYSSDKVDLRTVTNEEHNILSAFLKCGSVSMSEREIEDASGVTNVSRVVRRLCGRYDGVFARAIRLPGVKGAGGYLIRVSALAL